MNYLNKVVLALFVLLLSACGAAGKTTNPLQYEDEGGITAGGGGTLPVDPITVDDVYDVMRTSKQVLRLYINFKRLFPMGATPTEKKYFFAAKNLGTVLEMTDVEVLRDQPCEDRNGKDVDGSIYASKPGRICLSAYRVAPKLMERDAHSEIDALLLHELSHLLGSTEKEAVELQKSMVHDARIIDFPEFNLPDKTSTFIQDMKNVYAIAHDSTWLDGDGDVRLTESYQWVSLIKKISVAMTLIP